jgi:hypothetical protein
VVDDAVSTEQSLGNYFARDCAYRRSKMTAVHGTAYSEFGAAIGFEQRNTTYTGHKTLLKGLNSIVSTVDFNQKTSAKRSRNFSRS